jgi:hypothetical protein
LSKRTINDQNENSRIEEEKESNVILKIFFFCCDLCEWFGKRFKHVTILSQSYVKPTSFGDVTLNPTLQKLLPLEMRHIQHENTKKTLNLL